MWSYILWVLINVHVYVGMTILILLLNLNSFKSSLFNKQKVQFAVIHKNLLFIHLEVHSVSPESQTDDSIEILSTLTPFSSF